MKKINIFVSLFLLFFSISTPAQAQDKTKLEDQLRRTMNKETAMTEDDIKTYIANSKIIYYMSHDPQMQKDALTSIGKWSESRYAYVTTKIAAGMSLLVNPNDPRNSSIPAFAKPTKEEMDLLTRYREDIVRAVEAAAKQPDK